MQTADMPLFELADRGTLQLWQHRDMLVAVLHGDECAPCRALRAAFREREESWYRGHVGVVVVPLADPEKPRDDQLARVSDALFESLAPFGVALGEPCIAVSDRYGRIFSAVKAHAATTAEVIRDALEWIDFIQEQCDECGVPIDWE